MPSRKYNFEILSLEMLQYGAISRKLKKSQTCSISRNNQKIVKRGLFGSKACYTLHNVIGTVLYNIFSECRIKQCTVQSIVGPVLKLHFARYLALIIRH